MTKVRGVYERDKGSGVWWIRYAGTDGREHREKIGPFALAVKAYQKRKVETVEGRLFPSLRRAGIRYEVLFDDFSKHKPNHWSGGRLQMVRAWFKGHPAAAVTPQMITEKLNVIEKDHAPATLNRYRAILSTVYQWAVRNGKMNINPARLVRLRRENNERVRYLTSGQEAAVRASIRKDFPKREPEFDLALHTGMRRGEQYGLRWSEVDLARGVITIVRSKNGNPRYIPINSAARLAIELLRTHGSDPAMVCPPRREKNGSWFKRAVREAGVRDFRWHDLRHTFATRLVASGAHLRVVQELLGHKTVQMTLRYSHVADSQLRQAVDAISSHGIQAEQPKKGVVVLRTRGPH